MGEFSLTQILSWEFLTGSIGGMFVTAFVTNALKSFVRDKMGHALKHWEKVGCAFVAAFVVALAWAWRSGAVNWSEIPSNVLVYTAWSSYVYVNVIKWWKERRDKE